MATLHQALLRLMIEIREAHDDLEEAEDLEIYIPERSIQLGSIEVILWGRQEGGWATMFNVIFPSGAVLLIRNIPHDNASLSKGLRFGPTFPDANFEWQSGRPTEQERAIVRDLIADFKRPSLRKRLLIHAVRKVLRRRLQATTSTLVHTAPKRYVSAHGSTLQSQFQLPPEVVVIFFVPVGKDLLFEQMITLMQHEEFVKEVIDGNPEPSYKGIKAFANMHVPGDTVHDVSFEFIDANYSTGVFRVPVPLEPGLVFSKQKAPVPEYIECATALHDIGSPLRPRMVTLSKLVASFGNKGVWFVDACRTCTQHRVSPKMLSNDAVAHARQLGSNVPTRPTFGGRLNREALHGLQGGEWASFPVLVTLAGLKRCLDVAHYGIKADVSPFTLRRQERGITLVLDASGYHVSLRMRGKMLQRCNVSAPQGLIVAFRRVRRLTTLKDVVQNLRYLNTVFVDSLLQYISRFNL